MFVPQSLEIVPLESLESLIESLRIEGLPYDDLYEPEREFFQFLQGGHLAGYVGVEGLTEDRLLRSFVVDPSLRGTGIGAQALALVEALLVSRGVTSLHLLTTTAAPFFLRHGFANKERSAAPPAIQRSQEFLSLCPSTASYMAKQLT
ncbi:arsenic resistance N-acetyltransferase ArsN2 [Pseudomonas antarctica]|uniref:arsenic resistance N-acetyltransferase ArsN2 n=1 Tax=Pseudomonas antarctica TaxID=219572 RepID=UPI00345CBD6C